MEYFVGGGRGGEERTVFGADVRLLGDLALGHQLLLGLGGRLDEGRRRLGNGLGRVKNHLVKVHLLVHNLGQIETCKLLELDSRNIQRSRWVRISLLDIKIKQLL
jgi:hypothetical protein